MSIMVVDNRQRMRVILCQQYAIAGNLIAEKNIVSALGRESVVNWIAIA